MKEVISVMSENKTQEPNYGKRVGPDTPMTLDIQTQQIIEDSIKYLHLKPVENPIGFEKGGIPTVNGLYSDIIFGVTSEERKRQWGYINLNTKIIHPFVFKVLKKLQPSAIDECCSGKGVWKVTKDGEFVKCKENDPEYNLDHTGLDYFISILPKIKFKENKSRERKERIDFFKTFSPEDYLIDKWLVQPVFYRDIEKNANGPASKPQINNNYMNLIRYAKSLQFNDKFLGNMAKYNLQVETEKIHDYFMEVISKGGSNGFFKDFVVGKSPDYGYRSVISCMVLDQYDKPSDVPIDTITCGVPLAEVCVILFPYIWRWISNYLTNQFEAITNKLPCFNDKGEVELMELDDPMAEYSPEFIKKKIDKWIDSFESRNEPVTVRVSDGTKRALVFMGRPFDKNDKIGERSEKHQLAYRPFTWTDLLYIAATECAEDKHVWVTRYPLVSYAGVFPCKIHVMSTIHTMPMVLKLEGVDKKFPYYPILDVNMTPEQISAAFNDTINMDNSFLEAIGGDYDGDTVSLRSVFSVEANEETEDIILSKKQYINAQGKIIRTLGNEAILSLYSLTRTEPGKAKMISDAQKNELLSLKSEDVGIRKLTQLIGTTSDVKTKKIKDPKFRVYDTIKLRPNEYINKKEVTTTVGMFLFNKICIEPYIASIVPDGYWNTPLNKDGIGVLFDTVSSSLEYDKITTEELWPWLKAIQFYAYKGTSIFSSSLTKDSIMPDKHVIEERDKFFKNNPNPTVDQVVALEERLSKEMKEKISKDTSKTLFDSGAKAKVDDQLKNINTIIGPVYNPATGEFDIIKSNYIEGFSKQDIPKAGNMVVSASYPKAVGTADAGYVTKQFYAAFGSVVLGEDGSDCHTKAYLKVPITEDNWKGYEGQNVMVGPDKHETITLENHSKFVGKTVKLRSPMCCISERVCSVCAGRRPYMTGMTNIGTQFATVPNTFLNAGMKKFHTTKVKLDNVKEDTLFI